MQVTSVAATDPAAQSQFFNTPQGQRLLGVISDKTGISQDDLKSQLQSGTSLKDILSSKGLTFGDIRQAMQSQGSAQGQPAGAGTASAGGHHHHGGKHVGGSQDAESAILTQLATTLNLDKTDLASQLKNGQNLSQVASQQGVSPDTLNAALQKAFQSLSGYSANGSQTSATPAYSSQLDQAA